jgi:hypothetical protein
MKKFQIIILFSTCLLICWYIFNPIISLKIQEEKLINLSEECTKSKKDLASLDLVGERESIETRVNLFMNAKANEFSCFDLLLLEKELLAKRVSKEKIKFLKLQSLRKDPKLIEKVDLYN